jgi:hypothetical protein
MVLPSLFFSLTLLTFIKSLTIELYRSNKLNNISIEYLISADRSKQIESFPLLCPIITLISAAENFPEFDLNNI